MGPAPAGGFFTVALKVHAVATDAWAFVNAEVVRASEDTREEKVTHRMQGILEDTKDFQEIQSLFTTQ